MRANLPVTAPWGAWLLAFLPLLWLSGCGTWPWFGRDPDPHPPSALAMPPPQELDARLLWTARIGKGSGNRRLGLTPALRADAVLAADASGRVVAVAVADGRMLWSRETRLPLSAGPEVRDDILLLGASDGSLLALDARDGSERWRARLTNEILAAPRIAEDLAIVHTVENGIHAIALANGEERWRLNYPTPTLTLHGSSAPTIVAELAVVGLAAGRLVAIEWSSGVPSWETVVTPPRGRSELDRIADIVADPLVMNETVYAVVFNGDLAAVDLLTGAVLWRRELSSHVGLTAEARALYIVDQRDTLWAADPADGSGLWKQDALRNRRLSAPALDGNYLVVGDFEGWLHWLSREDGRLLARVRVARAPIGHRPIVLAGRVFVYANDGTLAAVTATAFGGTPPSARPRP